MIVNAGDKVSRGQILFVLDPEQDAGGLKEKTLEAQSFSIQKRRYEAQLEQRQEFSEVETDDPKIYRQELSQLKLELSAYKNEIDTYKSEKKLIRKEIGSVKITIKNLENLSDLLSTKFQITKQLYEKKYEGKLAFWRPNKKRLKH